MKHYVYILQSLKDNGYYIGCTANLEDRLIRHQQGRSKATKTRRPFILVLTEEYSNKSQALKREREIKNWKSSRKIEALIASSSVG